MPQTSPILAAPVERPSQFRGMVLPLWAYGPEARPLLERIVAERPEPTLRNHEFARREYRYAGNAAHQLRKLFDIHFRDRMDFCDAARPDMDLYNRRRNAAIAYAERNDADALIERLLAECGE